MTLRAERVCRARAGGGSWHAHREWGILPLYRIGCATVVSDGVPVKANRTHSMYGGHAPHVVVARDVVGWVVVLEHVGVCTLQS